jgi:hypothetical protein
MPGLNQKGPMGQGPMTGRQLGRCTNFGAALKKGNPNMTGEVQGDYMGELPGRGYGYGRGMRGRGRGMGRMHHFRGGL